MRLSFFRVEPSYVDFLRQEDGRVPFASGIKARRPFVGIVLAVNGIDYYAPLTSPKVKHLKMKNQVDFLKINEGKWGAINLNNMIPVVPASLLKVDLKIRPDDAPDEQAYKTLLANQLSWCNQHRDHIRAQAVKLHSLIISGEARPELSKRCCNFSLDEQRCTAWVQGV
jgi:protein AbiQ